MSKWRTALVTVALTGAAALPISNIQAQERFRAELCTRELARSGLEAADPADSGLQRQIAETCGSIGVAQSGIRAARARFYSGRAYSRLPNGLDEAIRQLEIAVNTGQDFASGFRLELRAARLELARAYRMSGRIEAARNQLANPSLRQNDPAVAYQRAMLILAELGSAGEESAYDALKGVFYQDEAQLRGTPDDPTRLTPAEIRQGRSWLYWLGMSLGKRALGFQARDAEQRRTDALRAIEYFRPVAETIRAACPEPQPLTCASGIDRTEQINSVGFGAAPDSEQLLGAFFQLGFAHLKAAGVQEMPGLAALGGNNGGEAGRLDCFSAQIAPDASSHFQNARNAFNFVVTRSPSPTGATADARWGLGCAILANLGNIGDPAEQQRQLAQAVEHLRQAPDRSLTLLTLARAQVLQGQTEAAQESYRRALQNAGANTQCRTDDPEPSNRAELPSRIYLEMARTRYSDPSSLGLRRRVSTDAAQDLYARTITDVINARPASLRQAEPELRCAVWLDYNNAEARLILGHMYLRLGADPSLDTSIDPPPFARAGRVLQYFERPTSANTNGRAEGLYLLSRRLTLIQQHRLVSGGSLRADGAQAVAFATQAYNTTQRPQFRRQACLAQTLFGLTREEGYCSATGAGTDRAESLLFEGMYWLRRGQRERGNVRLASWSRAIQAYNRGLAEVSDGQLTDSVHPTLPSALILRDLLYYGERYVLRCARLDYGDSETASTEVKAFFKLSGMPDPCGGSPR